MSANNQQMTTTGSNALAPQRLQFGRVTDKGYVYDDGVEIDDQQMLDEAKRLAAGYAFIDSSRPFVIGTFVRASEKKVGETASSVYDIFGMKFWRLKNVLGVIDNVPQRLWNPSLPFEIHTEVAYLPNEKDQEALLKLAADGTVGKDGEQRPLTVSEFKAAKKAYLASMATTTEAGEDKEQKPETVAPFRYTLAFRAPEPKEAIKDWTAAMKAAVLPQLEEAAKCYTQPKYAAQKAEKERKAEFQALLKDVPTADQAQFVALFDKNVPMTGIVGAVRKYQGARKEAEALDKLLETVPEGQRGQFQKMAGSGKAIKEVKAAVNDFLSVEKNRTAIKEALDTAGITAPEERNKFHAMLGGETPMKLANVKTEIRNAGKALTNETKRKADIAELVATVPEEHRAQFVSLEHEGKTAKQVKEAINAWRSVVSDEQKQKLEANRKTRKEQRAKAQAKLKSATSMRETGDPEDLKRAATLEAEANELIDEANRTEKEDQLAQGIPAHGKPKQKAAASGDTKKKSGKKTAKKGNKRH